VRNVLEPGDRRLPRHRRPDREHDRATRVLAVRRLEDEAVAVHARRLPSAAVADFDAGTLDERCEAGLHLGTRRNVPGAVHHLGDQRLVRGLVADQAVVVVELVLARPAQTGCFRLRPADQPVEDREAAEHPAGLLVRGDHGVLDPEPRERVARLQPGRSAPDDDQRIATRWERPL
jgi:hypothetical protein